MTKCDLCNQPAVYHDIRIVDDVHNTVHLCQQHAIEQGIDIGDANANISVVLEIQDATQTSIKQCPCGMTISKYKKHSLLGCPRCYETFKDQITTVIASVQDSRTEHVGKSPKKINSNSERKIIVRRLRQELDRAINKEEYENAAKIRDKIERLSEK